MTSFLVAALPMYDWPETRGETDGDWAALRERLHAAGIDAPERLARRNSDLPPVPGGIRDVAGRLIAPDPATLAPDGFDLPTLFRHPSLLFAQTCWGPLEHGLDMHVQVVGQPSYSGIEGGEGNLYSSAVLMRARPARSGAAGGLPIGLLRGTRLAFNGPDSMSGILALERDLAAEGESLAIFSERIETGSHRASIIAVAEGRADVCAIDCRTWDLAKRFEPGASHLAVVGWTAPRLGLPFVTSRLTPPAIVGELRRALQALPKSLASSG